MRYLLTAMLLLHTIWASAQQHSIYADIGFPVGFSATYNYQLTKNLGAGAGIQGQRFYLPYSNNSSFIPAIYADLHVTAWATRKNRFITYLNLGMNIHKQDQSYHRDSTTVFNIPHNNGFYTGFGLGYFRRITKRGGGAYIALKLVLNWHNLKEYSIVADSEDRSIIAASGTPLLAIGFKF